MIKQINAIYLERNNSVNAKFKQKQNETFLTNLFLVLLRQQLKKKKYGN